MPTHQPRSVVVTGAARGIGLATVRLFAELGDRVLCVDVDPRVEVEARLLAEDGRLAEGIVSDVSRGSDVDRIADVVLGWTGRVDVLVNNAAVHRRFDSIEAVEEDDWDQTMAVNVRSMYALAKRLKPALARARASIVNVASIVGPVIGSTVSLPYATSKSAVVGFSKSLALEMAPLGVRVNCVCPGPIDTELTRRSLHGAPDDDAEHALRKAVPLGRLGTATEVACAIGFLASAQSTFITGAILLVDGGLSVR